MKPILMRVSAAAVIAAAAGAVLSLGGAPHRPDHRMPAGGSSVVLSEVMFDPLGSEFYDEFIEIYNISPTDSVDLSGWKVGDEESWDRIVSAGEGTLLAPGQFGLILDSGYWGHSTSYDSLIPGAALVLTIDGASFGRSGLTNSKPHTVRLQNAAGEIVAAYTYTIGNPPGHSDEKIDLNGGDRPDNWANSLAVNGTPGFRNSVSPHDWNLTLRILRAPSRVIVPSGKWTASFSVRNTGLQDVSGMVLQVTAALPGVRQDSLQLLFEKVPVALAKGDSLVRKISVRFPRGGIWNVDFRAELSRDEVPSDNRARREVSVAFPAGAVVINEIMYYPETGMPEWVELFNPESCAVDLRRWRIATELDTESAVFLTRGSWILRAGAYGVLSRDSTFLQDGGIPGLCVSDLPALRNSGSELVLFGPAAAAVDTAEYRPEWGRRRGYSLERVWYERSGRDSANWRLSGTAGGTPGAANSVSPLDLDLQVRRFAVFPNPVPLRGRAVFLLTLQNGGRRPISGGNWRVFEDLNGDTLFQSGEPALSSGRFDGPLMPGDSLEIRFELPSLVSGSHVVVAAASAPGDQDLRNSRSVLLVRVGYAPGSVVINEIQYAPAPGKPEWLELFNPTDRAVNLQNWTLRKPLTGKTVQLAAETIRLPSQAYLVLASDSLSGLPAGAGLLVLKEFPGLANAGEALQLLDFSGTVMDSVLYSPRWGGGSGVSLERINPRHSGTDSSNWAASADGSGATPGRRNSVYTDILPARATLDVTPNPFSPDGDGFEDIAVIQYNLPLTTAYVSLRVFNMQGRCVRQLLNCAPSGSHREIFWNGKGNNGETLRMGIYILFLEALNSRKGVIVQLKKPVVLARKL